MKLKRIDHIGINVADLEAAKDFFVTLGMEVMGDADVSGDIPERVMGLPGSHSSLSMLKTPDGTTNIELVQFHNPQPTARAKEVFCDALPNAPGIRHLTFAVEGLEEIVAKLEKKGGKLMGEIVNYQDIYKLCYLRGPEGIILELAEELG
jgi:catechol 2,3-dioxygenase-like lactoylglutathione lyase family enzyme